MTHRPPPRWAGSPDRWIAVALFVLVGLAYAATMCRTIYTGDDGDFITAMVTGGVPHPSGYPLFVLLGRFWVNLFPFGNPAFKVNLLTALLGAGAVAMFYRFAALLVKEWFWAALAALLLAFGPTFWQQSLSTEVYSLTCLFLTTLLYLAALWQRQPQNGRLLTLLAFTYGLACTNHLTILLYLPGFLAFVLLTRSALLREAKTLLPLVVAFVAPLSLYAYLPLAARTHPPVAWGDPTTLRNFVAHVTGEQFRHLLYFTPAGMAGELMRYGGLLLAEYGFWFLWLVPVGAVVLWRQNSRLCALLAWIWAADVAYATNYHIFDIYVYYLPSYIAVAALLTVGASAVNRWVYDQLKLDEESREHYAKLVAVVALVVPIVQHAAHYRGINKSNNYLEEDFSANVLRSAPPGALVLSSAQPTFTLWYRRFVLHERQDVTPVDRGFLAGLLFADAWYYRHLQRLYPDITHTYAPSVAAFARASPREFAQRIDQEGFLLDMAQRAIERGVPVLALFQEPPPEYQNDIDRRFYTRLDERFDRVPWGAVDRLYLKGQSPPPDAVVRENDRLWSALQTRGLFDGKANADPLQAYIPYRYALSLYGLGKQAEKARQFDAAMRAYEQTTELYEMPEAVSGMKRCAAALERSSATPDARTPGR